MNKFLLGFLDSRLLDPNPDQSQNFYTGGTSAPAADPNPAGGDNAQGGQGGEGQQDFSDGADQGEGDGQQDFSGEDQGNDGQDDGQQGTADGQDGQQPQGGQQQPQGGQQQPQLPATIKLDAETIAQIRAGGGQQQQPQGGQGDGQLTKEQIQKMLNPVVVTPELLKGMGIENATPEQIQGFQVFANATVKNAVSVARMIVDQQVARFEEALGPIFAERERQAEENVKNEFFGSYAHLKPYDKLVKAMALEILPQHADGRPKSRQEIFKELAAKTVESLTSFGVQIKQQAPVANHGANGGNRQVPGPNRIAPFGRSGGGEGRSNKQNNPDADIYRR